MSRYPELLVLRHGETEWNRAGRMQGGQDSPLTPDGEAQMRALGRRLAALGLLDRHAPYTSPQGRTVRSAALVLEGTGRTAIPDPRLAEVGMGTWQGLTLETLRARHPAHFAPGAHGFAWKFEAPEGERLRQVADRCRAFLEGLQAPALVVTHGVTSALLRGLWLEVPDLLAADLPDAQGSAHLLAHAGCRTIGPD